MLGILNVIGKVESKYLPNSTFPPDKYEGYNETSTFFAISEELSTATFSNIHHDMEIVNASSEVARFKDSEATFDMHDNESSVEHVNDEEFVGLPESLTPTTIEQVNLEIPKTETTTMSVTASMASTATSIILTSRKSQTFFSTITSQVVVKSQESSTDEIENVAQDVQENQSITTEPLFPYEDQISDVETVDTPEGILNDQEVIAHSTTAPSTLEDENVSSTLSSFSISLSSTTVSSSTPSQDSNASVTNGLTSLEPISDMTTDSYISNSTTASAITLTHFHNFTTPETVTAYGQSSTIRTSAKTVTSPYESTSNETERNETNATETNSSTLLPSCQSPVCKEISAYLRTPMNLKADPCVDFREFACGKWSEHFEIPHEESSWGNYERVIKSSNGNIKLLI